MYKGKKESVEKQISTLEQQLSDRRAHTLEMESRLAKLKTRLTEIEQEANNRIERAMMIIRLRDEENLTLKEIGIRIGVHPETVRQLEAKGRRHIRLHNEKNTLT